MKTFRTMSLGLTLTASAMSAASGQSVTAGDIRGTVTDSTGAAIPNATVTVKNVANGETKVVTSGNAGTYRVSLLNPGTYMVSITAAGFSTANATLNVAAGEVTTDNLALAVGQSSTVVDVAGDVPQVLNTENADLSTAFTSEQIQSLPNPGNDLTFIAQTAPGSVQNVGGQSGTGYGNFSSFGLPGLSNLFTLDGGYENDPFLNLNNTGASNLTLGNNEVDTVTVVSPAFSAQFGGLGGAQVNEITKAGGNRVHGNLNYYWSGRALNANDWFNKQNQAFNGLPNKAQFVNANQYAASIGGPIIRDRLFFFVNTEGIRVTTPTTGQVWVPSQEFQNCVVNGGQACVTLNNDANNNAANNPNSTGVGAATLQPFQQAPASQQPFIKNVFNTYNTSPFRPATGVTHDPNDVTADTYFASSAAFLTEYLITARVDYKIGPKDNFYIHYKQDKGIQPTYVDLVSPLFSALSPQPSWEGQINETHTFSPNIVNQLVATGNYYSAPFQNTNNYLPVAPTTIFFNDGDLSNTSYGGIDYDFPQGRRVTGYQIIDDLSFTKGRNTFRVGYNFRRDDVTDLPQVLSQASESIANVEDFSAGQELEHAQRFPVRLEQPVAVFNEGFYAQDSFKFTPAFTATLGLRVEVNSNPTCITNCLQRLNYAVNALPTGTTVPYNAATPGGYIAAGQHQAFASYQGFAPLPRASFAYQPTVRSVIRGGFGMSSDSFPGSIADTLLSNAPGVFRALVLGANLGGNPILLDPSTPGSGGSVARASNTAFQSAFNSGGTYTTTATAVTAAGGLYSTPSFTTVAPSIKYPTYEEYSLAFEQELGTKSTVSATYVGNHGYHEPITNGGTNLSTSTRSTANITAGLANYFPTVPSAKPIASFATLTNIYSGGSSNFNGVVLSATRRSKQLTLQFNYQFSKALDEVSNGGLEPFGGSNGDSTSTANPNNLSAQYGLADYNVKHNTTLSFVYLVPSYHRFRAITGGFEFSGNFFHESGLPYTILNSSTSIGLSNAAGAKIPGTGTLSNGTVNLFARQLNNNFDHHCGGEAHVTLPDGTSPAPCNFTSSFAGPTNFTQQARNTLIGPSYTDTDFAALKSFDIPRVEGVQLKVGAQFFNLFNHPNFLTPNHTLQATAPSNYGAISGTVSSPTNIFGSVGANASPRLIQLRANLTF